MPTSGFSSHTMEDHAEYISAATAAIKICLENALLSRGKASLLVSGGSSPKPIYKALSQEKMAWEKISVSLVDDRWVPDGARGSNAAFIRESLLQNKAASAPFLPLVNDADNAQVGAPEMAKIFDQNFPDPIDVCIMGMGADGHTASWFPNSKTLDSAFEIDGTSSLVWQDASGQVGSSGFNDRITVTLPIVMRSRDIFLLIPGRDKNNVWEQSADKDVYDAPVTTLRAADARLHVYTYEGA